MAARVDSPARTSIHIKEHLYGPLGRTQPRRAVVFFRGPLNEDARDVYDPADRL